MVLYQRAAAQEIHAMRAIWKKPAPDLRGLDWLQWA
jgi:hypothetical protein